MLATLDMLIFVRYNLHMNSIGAAPLVDAVRSNGAAGRIGEERNHENELAQWKQTNPVSTADCGGTDVWLDTAGGGEGAGGDG